MPRIIKNRQIVEDDWQVLALAAGETPDTVPLPASPLLLPLSVWQARRDEIIARATPVPVPPGKDSAITAVPDEYAAALKPIRYQTMELSSVSS